MILKEPYSSKPLKLFNVSTIFGEINRYITIDYAYIKSKEKVKIKPFVDGHITLNPVILYGLGDSEKDVTPLNHPLVSVQNNWIALDLRNFVRPNHDRTDYEIRNESEYRLAITRFVLSGVWFTGKQSNLYSLELAHFAFSSWLSDNLASKFGLDLGDKLRLRVLANMYYARQFEDYHDSDELTRLIIRGKNDGMIKDLFEEIYADVGELETVDDFCKACYTVTKNIRLQNLDYTVLVNIIGNNWVGANGKEMILLALEHPPTWVSLVYAAITQRSFKKNFVTSVVERLSKRGKDEVFLKQVASIVQNAVEEA